MKRTVVLVLFLAAVVTLLWWMPLFHFVPLDQQRAKKEEAAFNAADYAHNFWTRLLPAALENAADATTVLSTARQDPQAVRDQYGRSVGLGRTSLYFLRGSGTIVSVDKEGVGVALQSDEGEPDIVLQTGLLFGNAVRDSTGLISPSDFPNSQHYNDLSNELNRIVETLVLPALKEQAQVGRRVYFVGSAEVLNERDWKPLKLIPVEIKGE